MNCICGVECNPEIGSCEKHFEVDPESFQGLLLQTGLTKKEFCAITGTSFFTVRSWVQGARPAPPIALWAVRELVKKK